MTKANVIVILAAMCGCAGMRSINNMPELAGDWDGAIGRDGWSRPVAFHLEREGGGWHGKWWSSLQAQATELKDVEVRGDDVLFETDTLRFVGHLTGETISGTVVEIPAGNPAGDFSVAHEVETPYPGP